jgi:hypothetical protein
MRWLALCARGPGRRWGWGVLRRPTVCLGHGIGGKYIPVNIARLAESQYAGVSDDGLSSPDLTATQNYCKHVDATYYMEFLRRGYPPAHRLKYLTSY